MQYIWVVITIFDHLNISIAKRTSRTTVKTIEKMSETIDMYNCIVIQF